MEEQGFPSDMALLLWGTNSWWVFLTFLPILPQFSGPHACAHIFNLAEHHVFFESMIENYEKKHTLPHCTGNSPCIDWKHHSQGIRRQQHTQSQLPVKTFFFCVVAQSIVGYCNISNNIKGKLNYEISKSAARLKRYPHTEAWRQMMQCHGSCECLHGSQNSHYWHSSLYPRSTERSYKNNEVQQTRNNKRVSAVNSMECLSKRGVLIFSLLQNVLK